MHLEGQIVTAIVTSCAYCNLRRTIEFLKLLNVNMIII